MCYFFLQPVEQIKHVTGPALHLLFCIDTFAVLPLQWTFSPISPANIYFRFLLLNQSTFLSITLKWRKMLAHAQNINVSQHFNFHEWGSMKANTSIQLDKGRCFILVALYINDDKWRCRKPLLKWIRLLCMSLTDQSNYTSLLLYSNRFLFLISTLCSPSSSISSLPPSLSEVQVTEYSG